MFELHFTVLFIFIFTNLDLLAIQSATQSEELVNLASVIYFRSYHHPRDLSVHMETPPPSLIYYLEFQVTNPFHFLSFIIYCCIAITMKAIILKFSKH